MLKTKTEYQIQMRHLLELPHCVLLTTGRTGTDLLQSLFDSHPQVLMIGGTVFFHDFWETSKCAQSRRCDVNDFLEEFVGHYIEKFKSRYDYRERKDQLGENFDQSIDLDTNEFRRHVKGLLDGVEFNSRNAMVAVYGAYAMCLNEDVTRKKVLLHHLHHAERLPAYFQDFPGSRVIVMTRDPRANFVSGVLNWRKYEPRSDIQSHLTYYIHRIVKDADALRPYPNEYIVVRLERLGDDGMLEQLCAWMGVDFNDCLTESTWGGLLWHGDRLSQNAKDTRGFSTSILKNKWKEKLSRKDKYILNYLMHKRLSFYGYESRAVYVWDAVLVFILIPWPLDFEWHFFTPAYIRNVIKRDGVSSLLSNAYYYVKRVACFYQFFWNALRGREFSHPVLTVDRNAS